MSTNIEENIEKVEEKDTKQCCKCCPILAACWAAISITCAPLAMSPFCCCCYCCEEENK